MRRSYRTPIAPWLLIASLVAGVACSAPPEKTDQVSAPVAVTERFEPAEPEPAGPPPADAQPTFWFDSKGEGSDMADEERLAVEQKSAAELEELRALGYLDDSAEAGARHDAPGRPQAKQRAAPPAPRAERARRIPIPDPTPSEPSEASKMAAGEATDRRRNEELDEIRQARDTLARQLREAQELQNRGGDRDALGLVFEEIEAPRFEPDVEPGTFRDASDPSMTAEARQLARRFLAERERTEGLAFQPAQGYWANTYVPGDPLLRWLESRLDPHGDAAGAAAFAGMRLHDAVRPTAQPFDAPWRAALDVSLHADRRRVDGPERLLLQVGLQGTPRQGGWRPAMDVAVVVDLRETLDAEAATALRALLDALSSERDIGDRFHLFVAGRGEAAVLGPDDFRHGPVTVASQRLLVPGEPPAGGPTAGGASLVRALELAGQALLPDDDAPAFGTRLLLFATPRPLGRRLDPLVRLAHRHAVAGVPWSVLGVGDGADPAELQRLALAGQGHRRLLDAPRDAARIVDLELAAASRVIARALRLNLRLAPGVKLIEVVGSERLDRRQAKRVKEAEKAVDQRLARHLGIAADRGEDDEGIQILVPAFHAAASHVVLVDVVVPGPGPVAELTVRYKDLVYFKNGTARAHLHLGRGREAPGPLERGVWKNLLAQRFHNSLDVAGSHLAAGDAGRAAAELEGLRHLLTGLRHEVPDFAEDRELADDVGLLDAYVTTLRGGGADPAILSDSLRVAARRRLLPDAGRAAVEAPRP